MEKENHGGLNGTTSGDRAWASAKAKSLKVRNAPSFQTRNEGFFSRQKRKISSTLPRFKTLNSPKERNTQKLGRGRWMPAEGGKLARLKTLLGNLMRKFKVLILLLVLIGLTTLLWSTTGKCALSNLL